MEGMAEDLPLGLLPALGALLETESVTLAAKRLHVGQPAMSRTLERLREVTADALLVREGRRLVRTQRGAALLPEVRSLLGRAEQLLRPPRAFHPGTAQGRVTLVLGDDMQAALAPALLEQLRLAAPGLDLRVRPLSRAAVTELVRGPADVAVLPDLRAQTKVPSLEQLVLAQVYTRRFVTVSRRRRALSLAGFAAAEHVLVSPEGEEGGYVDEALAAQGRARRVVVAVPSFLAALALVRETDLVSTLPEDVVRALAPRLHRQPCPVYTPELPMCLAWAVHAQGDPRHVWLRAELRKALQRFGKGLA
jgi:DNA-binding transcriptional LysR family regulator